MVAPVRETGRAGGAVNDYERTRELARSILLRAALRQPIEGELVEGFLKAMKDADATPRLVELVRRLGECEEQHRARALVELAGYWVEP